MDKMTNVFCIRRSGRMTPEAKMAMEDFAVPYDAPIVAKTMANAHPIAPKKLCCLSPLNLGYYRYEVWRWAVGATYCVDGTICVSFRKRGEKSR